MEKLLTEVCKIQYGFPFDSSKFNNSEGMPLIRIRDISSSETETFTTEEYREEYVVKQGDILIGMDGEFNVAKWSGINALLNQRVCRLLPFDIDADYLYYFMPKILKEIEAKTPFVTVKHLSAKQLNSIVVPIPPLERQQFVAKALCRIDEITEQRKQQLHKLDELIKARFVEMFGDPEYNEKQWDVFKLETLCSVSSSKRIYKNELCVKGVPFLRISDLVNKLDTGSAECELYISEERYLELKTLGLVPVSGDVLVTARGTLGRCYTLTENDKFYFQDGMITWLYDFDELLTTNYLSHLFEMNGFRKQIDSLQAGSTVAYLSISMTKKLDVMLPPLELQEQFVAFVQQIDKSKLSVQKSLEKLEILKKALMQKYFG